MGFSTGFLVLWLGLSTAVAILASRYNRSAGGWFFFSVLLTPILGFAFVLALGPRPANVVSSKPATAEAAPETEDEPVSIMDAYRQACIRRAMISSGHRW